MNRNQIGKFTINNEWLMDSQEELMRLMGRMIIVRAENLWSMNVIEYVAISEYFEERPPGQVIPFYTFEFTGGEITCTKVES